MADSDTGPDALIGSPPPLELPFDLTEAEAAWLRLLRSMGVASRSAVAPLVGTAAGREALGVGSGGDRTVRLDEAAETAMLAVAERLAPEPFRIVSEELGEAGNPDAVWALVVDPVDGSLNAKRGFPMFSASMAAAHGSTLADVRFGVVIDIPSGVEYVVVGGRGWAGTNRVEPATAGPDVEVVILEAGPPDRLRFSFGELTSLAERPAETGIRIRQPGSLALSLCQVGLGAADVLVSVPPSRAVDIAAGLALIRESGGGAAALDDADLWSQPLDVRRYSPFVAWRAGLDGDRLRAVARRLLRYE